MLLAAGLTDINVALVVWTLVTFGLLLIVLKRFAWHSILEPIEDREKTIAEAFERAKSELMATARKESESLLAQARASIEEERRAAVAALGARVVDIAIEAAGRLLQTQMDEKKQ